MRWGGLLFSILIFLIVIMLLIYFFIPFNITEFSPGLTDELPKNPEFNIGSNSNLQFYSNMRYQDNLIYYKIDDACTLKKRNDMVEAFSILSDLTVLEFSPVAYGEELTITCSNENIVSGNTFVAGEGGVTNVTVVGDYHVILQGKILLIRDSDCFRPNIALHELLHSLGFDHSLNPNNIMYDTYDCDQTIGEQIPNLINELYSIPPLADLSLEDVSAIMKGRYLDINMTVRNNGFANASPSKIIISADGKMINEVDLEEIDIGYGRKISLINLWVNKLSIDNLELEIVSDFEELDSSNNFYVLSVKK
jgi:hypothetical protein